MIKLTRFNGTEFYLNPLHIESVEETPDTVITLFNGKKVIVKEKVDEITESMKIFFGRIGLMVIGKQKTGGEENGR